MRTQMYKFFDDDAAHPLFSIEGDNKYEMSGTFIGFEHDEFHADMTPDYQGNRYTKMSRLDHVFVRGLTRYGFDQGSIRSDAAIVVRPIGSDSIDRKTYPTDHCIIRCVLNYV